MLGLTCVDENPTYLIHVFPKILSFTCHILIECSIYFSPKSDMYPLLSPPPPLFFPYSLMTTFIAILTLKDMCAVSIPTNQPYIVLLVFSLPIREDKVRTYFAYLPTPTIALASVVSYDHSQQHPYTLFL